MSVTMKMIIWVDDDDSYDICDRDYKNWLHPNHVLIVNYLKSILMVL